MVHQPYQVSYGSLTDKSDVFIPQGSMLHDLKTSVSKTNKKVISEWNIHKPFLHISSECFSIKKVHSILLSGFHYFICSTSFKVAIFPNVKLWPWYSKAKQIYLFSVIYELADNFTDHSMCFCYLLIHKLLPQLKHNTLYIRQIFTGIRPFP